MKCDDCKEFISAFLDNDLDEAAASDIRQHLALCAPCAKVFEDFASILDFCQTEQPADILPPNSQALWCRINNLIESEIEPEPKPEEPPRRRLWHLSFPQLASAVLGIAVISSLLTVVGIKNYLQPSGDDYATRSAASQTTFEKVLSKVGLADTPQEARKRRLEQQQAAIEYWNARVQTRRAMWDKNMREAFDRNLNLVNESVNEYTLILQQNPEDEISGEMLDSVLNDKMELLREFSEL
jgi:hypothetical protein